MDRPDALGALVAAGLLEQLFDCLPDTVFFVKDTEARYVAVNHTLVLRCGLTHRSQLVGKRAAQVFPGGLGAAYGSQDRQVISTGRPLRRHLERHLYPGGHEGWCLTDKLPISTTDGAVVGLCGISRDMPHIGGAWRGYAILEKGVRGLLDGSVPRLRIRDIASAAHISEDALEDGTRRILGITPRQLVRMAQVEEAAHRLATTDAPIVAIAYDCGYSDHSAFSRAFRDATGTSPTEYRKAVRSRQAGRNAKAL